MLIYPIRVICAAAKKRYSEWCSAYDHCIINIDFNKKKNHNLKMNRARLAYLGEIEDLELKYSKLYSMILTYDN